MGLSVCRATGREAIFDHRRSGVVGAAALDMPGSWLTPEF